MQPMKRLPNKQPSKALCSQNSSKHLPLSNHKKSDYSFVQDLRDLDLAVLRHPQVPLQATGPFSRNFLAVLQDCLCKCNLDLMFSSLSC